MKRFFRILALAYILPLAQAMAAGTCVPNATAQIESFICTDENHEYFVTIHSCQNRNNGVENFLAEVQPRQRTGTPAISLQIPAVQFRFQAPSSPRAKDGTFESRPYKLRLDHCGIPTRGGVSVGN